MSIFIEKDNHIINCLYISNININKNDNKIVNWYMTNGNVLEEKFDTEIEASTRVTYLQQLLLNINTSGSSDVKELQDELASTKSDLVEAQLTIEDLNSQIIEKDNIINTQITNIDEVTSTTIAINGEEINN